MAAEEATCLPFDRAEVEGSLWERFAKVATAYPSSLALATTNGQLTYAELAARVEALAAGILRRTRDRDAPVAVFVDDRASMIAAMLATWRAGRICVPLDAALPVARLETMLRHSCAEVIVTDGAASAALAQWSSGRIAELAVDGPESSETRAPDFPTVSGAATACIIYTSGTTGEPKGVLKSHRAYLQRVRWSIDSLGLRPGDLVCALHSPASGAGSRDVLAPLLGGSALMVCDLRKTGFGELVRWIDAEQPTILCTVGSTLRYLLSSLDPDVHFPSLRAVRAGSEPLYRRDLERLREHVSPHCVFVTGYGTTEANGIAECRIDAATPLPAGRLPAGYALEGTEIVLRDENGEPVPTGEAGEVTVRSRFLSSGYWRRPDLTRAMFEIDPTDDHVLTYRTGDIGRMRPDGCLELLGRRDQQLKVRGNRIHPGEIEAVLLEHPAVREAIVTGCASESGDVRLAAYVVPQTPTPPTGLSLRRHLRGRLPEHMVPSIYITIDEVPRTANGKLDRQALPSPLREPVRESEFVAPRSPTEHQLADIWERVFHVPSIGANDDFFELGGDSLTAAALVSAVEETFGRALSPSTLLQASTVAELAAVISDEQRGPMEPVTALRPAGSRTPIFFLHNDRGRGLYTHALARRIDAERPFYAVHRDGVHEMPAWPTVAELAAERIRALRAARPRGPYVLGGHCHGGLIALEMARQLRADGEEIELVLMIDTTAPTARFRLLRRALNAADRLRGRAFRASNERFDLAVRIIREIGWRARYYQKRAGMLASAGIGAQVDFARRKLSASGRSDGPARTGSTRRFYAEPLRPINQRQAQRRAYQRYVPSRYSGRVALFRAEQFPFEQPDLGWSRYLPRLEVIVVPGDHHSCITRHVAAFAERVNDVLSAADRG